MKGREIVEAALNARTFDDARKVQRMIEERIGARFPRFLGDHPSNRSALVMSGGSFDHKIIENVTNMQDAVLERYALERFGSLAHVPYRTPREAAVGLLGHLGYKDQANHARVTFYESDPPTRDSKRLTVVFRDLGCGIALEQIPRTIFSVIAEHKEEIPWLQGAFGLGGRGTFINARAVVLVTRRAPSLLRPHERDRIAVAVVQWEQQLKTSRAYYLVSKPYSEANRDVALPFSIPAAEYSEFEPGTHLALISYGVEGYHRARHGDEKSFYTVANTRLFEPVFPIRFVDAINEKADPRYLRGLRRRLEDNRREKRIAGEEILPFNVGGTTYHLPVRFWFFAKKGEAGERKNFVAHDHAVLFISNGQVHKHWTPHDFKVRTDLRHLHSRILVVVDTDPLPIHMRSSLFTADRSNTLRVEEAIRLEDAVAEHIRSWHVLRELENGLIREAITGDDKSVSTLKVAQQISRAVNFRGFSLRGSSEGRGRDSEVASARIMRRAGAASWELYAEPTTIEGPEYVRAEVGKTKSITFLVNAVDRYIPKHATLSVICHHPSISDQEIATGELRNGRVRVSVAVPENAELGVFPLIVTLQPRQGGIGRRRPVLNWKTRFETVDNLPERRRGILGTAPGSLKAEPGTQVALVWSHPEQRPEWTSTTVGAVERPRAVDLANSNPEYAHLRELGEAEIPTLVLNRKYAELEEYIARRAKELSKDGIDRIRNEYAVGVGVGLLILEHERERSRWDGHDSLDDSAIEIAHQAIARSVINMLPKYDAIIRQLPESEA